MRIDIVTDTFAPDINGVAMTLGRLTQGLRERGHRVHVIRTGQKAGADETVAASVPLPGYPEVRVGLPKPFKLRAKWLQQRPDAVYVATEGLLGKSALNAANALGIPVATGFHTNFHQYLGRYLAKGLEPLAMLYLRHFHSRAQCTLTPSPEMAQRLVSEGIREVHHLGRGVDTLLFSPAKRCESLRHSWGAGPTNPVAIIVGRVAAEKNLELGFETFLRMRAANPATQCVVVGSGPLLAELSRKHPWAHFPGVLTGEELARHYASADVLLFPSTTETFGNVLLEGMASGLATVSFDYAASALHVRHGSNGLKSEMGNTDAFAAMALEALAIRPHHPLRIRARESAEQHGWDQVVGQFEGRLADVASRSKSPQPAAATRPEPGKKFHCRTLFLSDIHLGTASSKADEVVDFLKRIRCRKLILNGDIIDGWALKRGSPWTPRHTRVIRRILKMNERHGTEVVYLRGNHDEILGRFLPLALGTIRIVREHIHTTADGRRYLIVHGDGFDSISTRHRWLAWLGAVGYDFLLWINRAYNHWRAWRGKEYFSLSKAVKARVKSAVCFIDRYEQLLQQLAKRHHCHGIVCGHIHTPEDKMVDDVHYLNCGDWVESMSAVIEHDDGRLELIRRADLWNAPAPAPAPAVAGKSPAMA